MPPEAAEEVLHSAINSRNWYEKDAPQTLVGEIKGAPRPWRDGSLPDNFSPEVIGTPEQFAKGLLANECDSIVGIKVEEAKDGLPAPLLAGIEGSFNRDGPGPGEVIITAIIGGVNQCYHGLIEWSEGDFILTDNASGLLKWANI
jgi:hypothetical protein